MPLRGPHRGRRTCSLAAATALVVSALAGCGGGTDGDGSGDRATAGASGTAGASRADLACRARWTGLARTAEQESRVGTSVRKAFAGRWNAVGAGIDYYVQVAGAGQCGDLLTARRTTITTLAAVVAQALPYDAGQRRATVFALRGVYAALPEGGTEPDDVKQAYATLAARTPEAATDLAPAYAELARADPTDTKAVAQGVSDIALLSKTSDAYAAGTAAVATIDAWNAGLTTPAEK